MGSSYGIEPREVGIEATVGIIAIGCCGGRGAADNNVDGTLGGGNIPVSKFRKTHLLGSTKDMPMGSK
jgi:hypothetical protein